MPQAATASPPQQTRAGFGTFFSFYRTYVAMTVIPATGIILFLLFGVPPFRETRDYVKRVQRLFPREMHPYDAGVVAPSPIVVDCVAAAHGASVRC